LAAADPGVEFYVTANAPLAASDLTVSVDKQPAQVASVRSAKDDPLLFAILLDVSGSQKKYDHVERAAAWTLFQSLYTKGNRGVLAYFSDETTVTRELSLPEASSVLNGLTFKGASTVFASLAITGVQMQKLPGAATTPRKVIILLSDGGDNVSRMRPDEVEERMEDSGIAVFSLAIGEIEKYGQRFLNEIGPKTGGQTEVRTNAQDGVNRLLQAINGQMAVRIVPTQQPDQKHHSLTVKSAHKDAVSAPAAVLLR
jgi:Mg-chelatase subunit ChlD